MLRLITWLPMGGIERKIAAVLPRLNHDLFEPHVCCIRERGPLADQLEQAGIPVHVIPFRSRWDPVGLWKLHSLVNRLQIDLIHSHMYRANVPATVMKMGSKQLLTVGHYHNMDTWETPAQEMVDRWLAAKRDANLAVSEAVRLNVLDRLGLPGETVRTVYNGVDLEQFHPVAAAERHATRERLGVAASAKVVIMVARLVGQKNHELVVRAAQEIVQAAPKVCFLFVGDGPLREQLEQLARQLHVEEHILFLGARDDVPQLLAASDIAILPSLKEGFSNAVLEAMACGLPVIASDVGGNREVIDHGRNGFILDIAPGDGATLEVNEAQFVRYLRRLLSEEDFRSRMAAAALEHVRNFSLDVMVYETEQLYLDLLEAAHAR